MTTRPTSIRGSFFNCSRYLINIRVKAPHEELNNEVKRLGYIRDRETEMQIRVGDTLIVYISNAIA